MSPDHLPSTTYHLPLVVIAGPTASGKTALAINLAKRYGGEIICADSRTVYQGIDIGTAKPTQAEQAEVPHHLLDVAAPDQSFNAADFKRLAMAAVDDIRSRGKIPFLVGGTGLYLDSVILDYQFATPADPRRRASLQAASVEQLHMMHKKLQLELPNSPKNKLHLVNNLLRDGQTLSSNQHPDGNTIVVAIATDRQILKQRIQQRAEVMFEQGVVDEAVALAAKYGWESPAMTGNIYPVLRLYLEGAISHQQAIDQFVSRDYQLAKRQLTWLRRHDFITWLPLERAEAYLSNKLDRY